MKTFRRIFALCLALVLALSLAACKKKNENTATAEELIASAPLVLELYTDVLIQIGFDESGNTLAVLGVGETGAAAVALCEDVSGKPAAEAMSLLLTALLENNYNTALPYFVLRQVHTTVLPSEDFLVNLEAGVSDALAGFPMIVIPASAMDADGYFNIEIATKIMETYLGKDGTILGHSEMIDGCYLFSCKLYDTTDDYSVSGYTGALALYSDLVGDTPLTEEDMIPEHEQFTPPSDAEIAGFEEENPEA